MLTDLDKRCARTTSHFRKEARMWRDFAAERIGKAAVESQMPAAQVHNVPTSEAAAAYVQSQLSSGVAVLLKGSRYAAHLERAVAILLDNPDRDKPYLVPSE